MKKYSVCYSLINDNFDGEYEKEIELREIYAQTIKDAVLIVQNELINEGKDPAGYDYTSQCENELYACNGVPQ